MTAQTGHRAGGLRQTETVARAEKQIAGAVYTAAHTRPFGVPFESAVAHDKGQPPEIRLRASGVFGFLLRKGVAHKARVRRKTVAHGNILQKLQPHEGQSLVIFNGIVDGHALADGKRFPIRPDGYLDRAQGAESPQAADETGCGQRHQQNAHARQRDPPGEDRADEGTDDHGRRYKQCGLKTNPAFVIHWCG